MNSISNDKSWKYSNFIENKYFNFDRNKIFSVLSKKEIDGAYKVISNWEGYSSTPLENLNKLSSELGIKNIFYKDESKRFNLKSFKALGGAYAVEKISHNKKKNNCIYRNCWESWTICCMGSSKTWIGL